MKFVFAREKDGKVHFRKRHPDVAVREVKELFHFRMAVQPTYSGALKGIGHPHSFAQIPGGYLQMGQEQGLRIRRYSLSGETSAR